MGSNNPHHSQAEWSGKLNPSELITNADGRLSTTGFIQFAGFVVLAVVLLWSVWLDRSATADLYAWFAAYCGGLTVSKGAVSAYRAKGGKHD